MKHPYRTTLSAPALLALAAVFSAAADGEAPPRVMGDHLLPRKAYVVSAVKGYNSWPMIQAVGSRLVCGYSRDNALPKDGHGISAGSRDSYMRHSLDGGRTWSQEVAVAADPKIGEVNEGIGLDEDGAVLLWVRCWGKDRRHELYRTADGVTAVKVASICPDPFPMQVMDVVRVEGLGLVSPWFAGNYRKGGANSWGILVSADNGRTWEQRVIEKGLSVKEWVTEPSLVDLGGGRLLIVGRCEQGLGTQFQVTSADGGKTWKKSRTNIADVRESTPSLLYDAKTATVANYYYHRGARKLKRRVADADFIFGNPAGWPQPEVLDEGFEPRAYDAGNVKATRLGDTDCCAWYTGTQSNATVVVTVVPKPEPAAAGPFRAADYAALRRQLRAFHPDECHGKCKDPAFDASDRAIRAELQAYAAAHPGYDALDLRRESYRAMRRHFRPFLFSESPFCFEAGVNGGWVMDIMPAREVNRLCRRFYAEKGLVPEEAFSLQSERNRQRYSLCCGPLVDDMHHIPAFHAVLTKGFKGVRAETAAALAACPADDPLGRKELETALEGLDTIHALQLKFAEAAESRLAAGGCSERERKWLGRMAECARRCPWEPPRTFFEGLNFLWFMREIPSYVDGLASYSLGRPDAWLIGLYRKDLASGALTEEEARDLVARWLIHADEHLDTRRQIDSYADQEAEIPVTLGGCDAAGEPVWNELTRMFLDAHIGCGCVFPKLHVRFGARSPQEYLEKIGEMAIKGHCVFAMFNDDITIGNFVRLGLPLERARDYVCCGCWDGNVDTLTDTGAAYYMSPLRVLEAMIHRDPAAERRAQVRIDPMDGAQSFEEVKRLFLANFMRFFRSTVSEYTRYGRSAAQVFPHPAYSACLEGCLGRRRDTNDGGTRFHPTVMTLAFTANVVDSLCAIDRICFRDRTATLPEFLDAVRSNWKGPRGEELRLRALAAPYWGDNSPESNGLMRWLFESVAKDMDGLRNEHGQPFVLAAWIYREFLLWGAMTKATPDGRRDGDRLAQGFAPSEYRCKEGASSVINAIGTVPHELLYASNANLTFDRLGMTPARFAAIFRVFAKKRAHLLQPNCNSVEILLDAQRHPERHMDLIVKVCGFSARFVSLSKRWQDEVIARHRLK